MTLMQKEVSSLNDLLTSLVAEKSSKKGFKCECAHKIRDLEGQVLDLHKKLYA
jgi:hypothetical protein